MAVRKSALEFREIREILLTVRGLCTVKAVDVETHELALDITERRHFSIYDALIVAAALRADCTVLYTEELRHNQRIETLMIKNPFVSQLD